MYKILKIICTFFINFVCVVGSFQTINFCSVFGSVRGVSNFQSYVSKQHHIFSAKPQSTKIINIAEIIEKANRSVVNVQSTAEDGSIAVGSGFCIDQQGYVVTNFHVIRDALKSYSSIIVVVPDGRALNASLRGYDESTDIALLEVDWGKEVVPALQLGNSDVMRVGDWVVAIGSPFELDHTVTLGIISGKGRTGLDGEYDDFLQTDAAINLGNSGGPLVNLKGEVVGINTLVLVRAQSLGFAIPVNILKDIIPQLRDKGYVQRSSIGVEAVDISAIGRRRLGLDPKVRGVLITKVERDLPGGNAGIRREDVVLSVNNIPIVSSGQFNRIIARVIPGNTISIKIWRDQKEYTITSKTIEKKR